MGNTLATRFATEVARNNQGWAAEILDLENGYQHDVWVHQCRECLGDELGMSPEAVHLMLAEKRSRHVRARCAEFKHARDKVQGIFVLLQCRNEDGDPLEETGMETRAGRRRCAHMTLQSDEELFPPMVALLMAKRQDVEEAVDLCDKFVEWQRIAAAQNSFDEEEGAVLEDAAAAAHWKTRAFAAYGVGQRDMCRAAD